MHAIIISKNRGHDLKENSKGYIEGLGGEPGKGEIL